MTSYIYFFDHNGEMEDVFTDLPTTPRSWVLNGYGRCEFSVPMTHAAANERFIRFGNLIHIEHIRGISLEDVTDANTDPIGKLLPWTGIILPPRTWNKDSISVVAYSLEAILAYRAMPFIDNVSGSPDAVFRRIMELTNYYMKGNPPFTINLGPIEAPTIATTYSDNLRTNAYDHIRKLVDANDMEWAVTGTMTPTNNALEMLVSLHNRSNGVTSAQLTALNTEEQDPLLTEQGVPWNQIFAYNQANTAADRIMQEIDFDASIADYGPFQINQTFIGQTSAAGVQLAALSQSADRGQPQRVFKRIALDKGYLFEALRPGWLVQVNDSRVGFNAGGGFGFSDYVRILSMDYNDTTDKVNLNVEIVTGVTPPTSKSLVKA